MASHHVTHKFILFLILLPFLHRTFSQSIESQRAICSPLTDCSQCINVAHFCAWCASPFSNSTRCIPILDEDMCEDSSLIDSNRRFVQFPQSSVQVLQDKPLGSKDGDQIILTQPQRVKLHLRRGETRSFNITSSPAPGYPLDLYLLMDLSSSMKEGFMQIQRISQDLVDTVRNITSDFGLGMGSFVDKPIAPFRDESFGRIEEPCPRDFSCVPTYGFHHSLNLTNNFTLFNETLFSQSFSRNVDHPEGTGDAIMQSAVCTDHIGWRTNSRHLILVVTDGTFHIANDGLLAGIIEANDGQCHLEYERNTDSFANYMKSTTQDYPSVGQLANKLQENNIFVVFAIRGGEEQVQLYEILSQVLGRSWVAKLEERAENVLDIINNAYRSLSQNVNIEIQQVPGVSITATPLCEQVSADGKDCVGIDLGDQAQFQIDVTLDKCISQTALSQINVLLYGQVDVEIEALCSCPCEQEATPNSPECSNGNGTYICGSCKCNPGRIGVKCDCTGEAPQDVSSCVKPGTNSVCSKHGQCVCGKCQCEQTDGDGFYGEYCECSDKSCGRLNGMLCGGEDRGSCVCQECLCKPGYEGSECECNLDNSPCIESRSGLVCSGRGSCKCGGCVCSPGYLGEFCQQCNDATLCRSMNCDDNLLCAECAFNNSQATNLSICEPVCNNSKHIPVHTEMDMRTILNYTAVDCRGRVGKCYYLYYVARTEMGEFLPIHVNRNGICDPEFPFWYIIIGIALLGLLICVILLIIIKVIIYYREYREYREWDKEVRDAIASKFVEAPKEFHKSVVQETTNPAFGLKNKHPLDMNSLSGYQLANSGGISQGKYAPLQESTTM